MHCMRSLRLGAFIAGSVAIVSSVATAQQGIVSGRIIEAGGAPIPEAQVYVVGTNLGTLTNQDGRYIIRGVRAGEQQVRAIRIGFSETKRAVTIVASQTTTLDLALSDRKSVV